MNVKQLATVLSRDLRKRMTNAEKVLWEKIRNKQFMGYKFLRQHPLFYQYYNKTKFFVADFYCRELRIIIEVDGGIHEKQKDYDTIRSEILETQHNLKIIRFKNADVIKNINKILIDLHQIIKSKNL